MLTEQHQQLYELWKNAGLIESKKTPENSRVLDARVIELKAKTDNSSDESLFADEIPKANSRSHPALDRKGSHTKESHTDT